MKRGRVYRSETPHKPSSVKACVDRSLKSAGVAETHQEKDEETVKQRKIAETADEFRTDYIHSARMTVTFFYPRHLWLL